MTEKENIGLITEQGDLGLGFEILKEEEKEKVKDYIESKSK